MVGTSIRGMAGISRHGRWLKTRMRRAWHRFQSWLFAPPFDRAWIEEEVLEDLCALAKGSYPKEMVAFLTGEIRTERMTGQTTEEREAKDEGGETGAGRRKEGGRGRSTKERVLVINGLYVKGYYADHASTQFTTHDLPLLDVYGTAHSHPGGDVRPSGADKELFSQFGWFHLIIGKPYTLDTIAVYDTRGRRIGSGRGKIEGKIDI